MPDTFAAAPAALVESSQPFVGQWHSLVSHTNWEKGRIIQEWRAALVVADAPVGEYSDETWALLVGGVTGQHVGRLRRVFERFGGTYQKFNGVYWSHFQAALDWSDAEMWLEGAIQNGWSVSHMRRQRWETLQPAGESPPTDAELVSSEPEEDYVPPETDFSGADSAWDEGGATGPTHEGPDFGDEASPAPASSTESGAAIYAETAPVKPVSFVQPFANLAALPDDLAEAFESFKLAILRHKADDWRQIAREELLASLDALKELALAPAIDGPAF